MDHTEEQQEELQALRAIFDEDLTEITSSPPCLMVKLRDLDVQLDGPLSLKVGFTPDYPECVPLIEVPMHKGILPSQQHAALMQHLEQMAETCIGMAMVFTLVDAAKQWINDNVSLLMENDHPHADNQVEIEVSPKRDVLEESKLSGGRWDYVIGLVGKPSAGKSTFFNASAGEDLAKTAPHPFTTIEPNISKVFYTIPCPCAQLSQRCNAAYGHSHSGARYMPVLLKDVAGLVPGACNGKGRGNRFLNDLLDADVLMHIVDVSGCTDEKGDKSENYDPTKDINWLKQELHQWIYNNIHEKWDVIKRRPQKLTDMFTGYHANKSIINTALQNAGVNMRDLSTMQSWNEDKLHDIVQSFLQLRFPIFLVLNKADTPTAADNIHRIQTLYPETPSLPVSAKAECFLQEATKKDMICYRYGDSTFMNSGVSLLQGKQQIQQMLDSYKVVLQRFGSTNVLQALSKAVAMRQPSYAFPVQCLDTMTSIDKFRGESPGVLRDCISLKPGTTCSQLYTIMCHYPLQLLAGDFIRAETLLDGKTKQIMRKDDVINVHNAILKIMTNRKVTQIKAKE